MKKLDVQNKIDNILNSLNDIVNESIEKSDITALEILALIKDGKFLDIINSKINIIEKNALDEVPSYIEGNNKSFELNGFKFEPRNGGVIYDFKDLKEWKLKKQDVEDYEKKVLKSWEKKQISLHKVLTSGLGSKEYYDEDGNQITLEELPKLKHRKSSIIIKRIKN